MPDIKSILHDLGVVIDSFGDPKFNHGYNLFAARTAKEAKPLIERQSKEIESLKANILSNNGDLIKKIMSVQESISEKQEQDLLDYRVYELLSEILDYLNKNNINKDEVRCQAQEKE